MLWNGSTTMSEDNAFERLSGIMEFYQVNEFLDDPEVEKALLKLTSILANPEINVTKVARHIVECDGLAASFAVKAKYYMGLGKDETDASIKKNLYMTLREEFHKLADSLKYLVKAQT